jgi:TonB-linked SusC/RagA family outer membrane protein
MYYFKNDDPFEQIAGSQIIRTMKLTCLILMAALLQVAATSYSQATKLDMKLENATVKDVFKTIETQSDFRFFYSDDLSFVNQKIDVDAKNMTVESLLDRVLDQSNLTYRIFNNNLIVVTPETNLWQGTIITGTIVDASGETMPGVNITVKGTITGTVTDMDGKYSINVPNTDAVLIFSFVGYTPQEIVVGAQTAIDVTLDESATELDEVVVVGYGIQKKRDLTGAISKVKMDDAPLNSLSTVSQALAGKVSGMRVTQATAQPGAGATFRIRGETSIKAGNAPLVVVDGFPVTSSATPGGASGVYQNEAGSQDNVLEMLNPNDIESIEVLKDASATAIYGARAGHGVILVTTKRGKEGRSTVTYSGNVSVQRIAKNYDLMNAQEYMKLSNVRALEQWRVDHADGIYANYAKGIQIPYTYEPVFTNKQIDDAQTTDWMKEITRTGLQHSHNLSLTGGTSVARYLASVNYFTQEGIIKNSGADRFTVNLNGDYNLSKYVKTGLSVNISRNQYDNVAMGTGENEGSSLIASALLFEPNIPVYDANGKYSTSRVYVLRPNPVSLLDVVDNTAKDRVLANAYIQVEPVKNLIFRANVGFDRKSAQRRAYYPSTVVGQIQSKNGLAHQVQENGMDYLANFTANYMKSVGNHSFTALAGFEFQRLTSDWFRSGNTNFPIDAFLYNNIGAGSGDKDVASSASQTEMASVFGRLNYSYLGKYLITATLRADGASNFAKENRWGYFPSISAGWRFSDEAFMEGARNLISNGKLRASFGQTGNSNVGNRTLNYFGPGDRWAFGSQGAVGMKLTELGNPAITWETTSEWNIGLDLGFLKNRINFTAEYYDRVISDLLVEDKKLASYGEITQMAANIGKTRGRGIELTLSTINVKNRDLEWTSELTFSRYEDRWEERDPDWVPAPYQTAKDPIRAVHGYRADGLLKPGEAAPAWQPGLLPGQIKMKKLDSSTATLGQTDRELYGSKDPAFYYGFNNTVRYKNFDLSVYVYGEVGRLHGPGYLDNLIPFTRSAMARNMYNGAITSMDSWTADNQSTGVPSILFNAAYGNTLNDYFYKKLSFLRCRNITLGYNIPVPKTIVNSIRVNFSVNNPFLLVSNYNGLDPETDYDVSPDTVNAGSYSYPNVRTFSFGVDVNF